jgi:hypothetical protein
LKLASSHVRVFILRCSDGDTVPARSEAFLVSRTDYKFNRIQPQGTPSGCCAYVLGPLCTESYTNLVHTYHSHFIPEGVAEAFQIFFRNAHVLPKLISYEEYCRSDRGKPIAVLPQFILGVSAINNLVAFYDIHGRKRELLFFYFVPDTTRDVKRV